jgi:hypothetical protein
MLGIDFPHHRAYTRQAYLYSEYFMVGPTKDDAILRMVHATPSRSL